MFLTACSGYERHTSEQNKIAITGKLKPTFTGNISSSRIKSESNRKLPQTKST
jgi:hypothetical protein